jgi:xylulokinase
MAHVTRSVMEGVAFGLRDGLDLMIGAGVPAPSQVRASGGGIKSPLWRQILADILDTEIAITRTQEGAAYGAGLLASVGAGWFGTVEEACESAITTETAAEPSTAVDEYRDIHERYKTLYPALAPVFHAG